MEFSVQPIKIVTEQINGLAKGAVELAPNLLAAVLMLFLTWMAAALIGKVMRNVLKRSHSRPSLIAALVKLAKITIWVFGSLIAATLLFPNLTPTKLLAGLGVGSIAIGLAFKDIFENFLAGFLILLRKPMRIGDDIECEGLSGQVEEISIRDTMLRKRSGELILVPNSFLFKNPVHVVTDKDTRRISVVVGVAYGEDVDKARDVILEAMKGIEARDMSRVIDVFAYEFNSSSIDFNVRWWSKSKPRDVHVSRDQAVSAIKSALDRADIEIPFPYRTMTFAELLTLETEVKTTG